MVSESIMSVSDIVSFEHQVTLAQDAKITAYYGSVIAGQLKPLHAARITSGTWPTLYCGEGRW